MTELVKPLDKIKRIRSWDEIVTRGGQALSVYREQRKAASIPTDEEFAKCIDTGYFGRSPIIAESLWQRFFKNGRTRFFPSFKDIDASVQLFRAEFGPRAEARFIQAADKILEGRIDLMGFRNLYVGNEIDWHREPLTSKRSPLQHWKQFDDLDSAETGNRKIVWELNRHQHFFTLGLAFALTGDERYARAFASQLDSWMDSNPPGIGINWSSSLEVSLRAISWIWAFHFFEHADSFTPQLFKRALKYLYKHGRHIEQYLSKYYSPNTHLTGEALGLYYLGTQIPYFDRSTSWRQLGEDILVSEIGRQILPDGVYFEQSTWYQRYTADIYLHFVILRALDSEARIDAGKQLEERMRKCFSFLRHITLPDGRTPLIGDDDGGRLLPLTLAEPDDFRGSLAVAAALFDDGELKVDNAPSQEVSWLLGAEGVTSYNELKPMDPPASSMSFPEGGYFVMRDGWADEDDILIVDCGDVGALSGGHGHADTLSIVASIHGEPLLVDPGTYTYHESSELRDYFRSTAAHNTLSIDGKPASQPGHTFGWKSRAKAESKKWISEDRFDFFEGSHDGYVDQEGATHSRSVLYVRGDYWVIRDLVNTGGSHEYALNFHFAAGRHPSIDDGGLSIGESDYRIYTFGDSGAWQQKESWVSNYHGNRVNAPFFRFVSAGEGTQEFWTFIIPKLSGETEVEVAEVPIASGRGFAIRYGPVTDVLVFNDEADKVVENGIFGSNFAYSWARLTDDEAMPEEFILIDGDTLTLGGTNVLDQSHSGHSSILRLGRQLYVKTAHGRYKAKLAVAHHGTDR